MKIDQSKDQLKKHLIEQIHFLQKSSKEFDGGDVSEAKRMATHIRVLLHDTGSSKSLLLSMEDKDKVVFLNSASIFCPQNLMSYMGLVVMRARDGSDGFRGEYKPRLTDYLKMNGKEDWKPFNDWWGSLL